MEIICAVANSWRTHRSAHGNAAFKPTDSSVHDAVTFEFEPTDSSVHAWFSTSCSKPSSWMMLGRSPRGRSFWEANC